MQLNKKLIYITGVSILVIALIITTLVIILNSGKTAELLIVTAPQNVKISFNGKIQTVKSEDVIKLKPGDYEFKFSKDNFNESSQKVSSVSYTHLRAHE